MKTILKTTILSIIILTGCQTQSVINNNNLSFQEINIEGRHFYLAKFSPQLFNLKIFQNTDTNNRKSIKEVHQQQKSRLTLNGGFYDESFQPMGYLTSEGKNLSTGLKSNLLNGVFTIDNLHQPKLYSYTDFKKLTPEELAKLDFALQTGPILLDQNSQIKVDPQNKIKANRSMIGIDKDNNLIVIIMRQTLFDQEKEITLFDLATILQNQTEFKDLGLHSTINLDGGPSTGLAVDNQYFPELQKVQNIITVTPIENNE